MYAILDFETSSLRPDRRATEIAIVCLDSDLNVEAEYETLLNPESFLEPHSLTVSNLSRAEILGGLKFADAWPAIAQALSGRIIVGHNIAFDLTVLKNELVAAGIQSYKFPSVCTQVWSREVFGADLDKKSLGAVCDFIGYELVDAHEAISDVRATVAVFRKLLDESSNLKVRIADLASEVVQLTANRKPATPVPRFRVSDIELAYDDIVDIAEEILSNQKVQKSAIVVVTGDLDLGEEEMNRRLSVVGLNLKETPTTKGTAFLIKGKKSGKTKIERAIGYGRPVVSEIDALRIIEVLSGLKK